MSEQLGNSASLQVSSNGGSSYSNVGEMKDTSFDGAQDLHDATSNDDNLWKVDVVGHKKMTINVTCNYDEADAGQIIMRAGYFAGSTLMFKYRPRGSTSTYREQLFSANFTSANLAAPTQGVMEESYTLETTGAVTTQAQP